MTEIQLTEICAEFAIMLVSYGAEIYRTEDTIRRICTAYGHKNAEIYVTPANFIITVKSPDGVPITNSKNVSGRNTNLDRVGKLNELLGAVEVKLEGLLVRAVIHDGREAGLDALEAVLVRTVIEVKGDGNGNARGLDGSLDHVGADLETAHPLSGTSGALKDQRRLGLLGGLENSQGPLEVVGVEGTETVLAGLGLLEHVCCVDEHKRNLL